MHEMRFGSTLHEGIGKFNLWAPAASTVELNLLDQCRSMTAGMSHKGDGWYSTSTEGLSPGAQYSFRIDGRIDVPDPASRFNPKDVHAASALTDPTEFDWPDDGWRGRPWSDAVVYELHVGGFTPGGTFKAAMSRLDYLAKLGVTAIELMPVADFPGKWNWGYDGVLPFAPDATYGSLTDLKNLVAAAHARGLMVLLDVVYNHFGPEGNYLHQYAPQFFNPHVQTPWGAAINFDGPQSGVVREFFVHNALYWLEEFFFDGLRLDAVHAIRDKSGVNIVEEIAARVHAYNTDRRHIHLILENDKNEARYLTRDSDGRLKRADAQWNDDVHHAFHVLITNERDGYYKDYADSPLAWLGRALAEGFAYQGEISNHRAGHARGEPSKHLPCTAFVAFLQNHDQVGNRALGERISAYAPTPALRLAITCLILAPQIPMLFMGEEFNASTPFPFFCDFSEPLESAVRDGRKREFSEFEQFAHSDSSAGIPDPGAASTFENAKLHWEELDEPTHRAWHALYSELLGIRHRAIVPHLEGKHYSGRYSVTEGGLVVDWSLPDGTEYALRANFSEITRIPEPSRGNVLYTVASATPSELPPWSAIWLIGR